MPASPAVAVTRRTRFGQDRLYVSGPDGRQLGWADLLTGSTHPAAPEWALVVARSFADWAVSTSWGPAAPARALAQEARPGARPVYGRVGRAAVGGTAPWPDPQPAPPAPGPVWHDLAGNWPGAAARARAMELTREAGSAPLLRRLLRSRAEERAWRAGAKGEELVAAQLHRLRARDPRWRLLHAVPVGARGSDIDHVVMGPGGVFTLNAKHHRGGRVWVGGDTVMVNGYRQPYVRNSRHEAARAARLLEAASGVDAVVQGVVVPVGCRQVSVRRPPTDVAVVPADRLVRWLLSRPSVLDEHTLWLVSEAARRSTTWQPSRG